MPISNGQYYADATDFAAQILMQALFELRPKKDILDLARLEVKLKQQQIWQETALD